MKVTQKILNEAYGVRVIGEQTTFKVWSPASQIVSIYLYKTAQSVRRKRYEMIREEDGIWSLTIEKDLTGQFYTYLVDEKYEVVDPYIHSTNANSSKGAIVSAYDIAPEGFNTHVIPKALKPTESILYELHVKDFSMYQESGFEKRGMYLAFTEKGLTYKDQKIGLDHLIELGITHVHLLPIYDFITVNDYEHKGYNWGYDPHLYNALEGSYSTEPDNPVSRILEFKQLVQALHEADIRVVLDVVYNHTYFGGTSNFERLMPGVYHRRDGEIYTNGSGCGNEVNSEHPFVSRFIIDSLKFYLEAYKVDGFRFDLMGIYDVDFVKQMSEELHEVRPDIILYGEPWTGGASGLELDKQFVKGKQRDLKVALFNDDYRNNLKGSNDGSDAGFIGLGKYRKDDIYAGCFGSIAFSNEIIGFAKEASDTVNYVSSHDNLILMDKMTKSFPHGSFEDKQNMNALALSMVILSFGIPFLQAGTEMLRSKYGDHNSYKSSYYINRIHWENKSKFRHVFDYTKSLIDFRKSQKVFALSDAEAIKKAVTIIPSRAGVIYYVLKSPFEEDYSEIHIIFNGSFDGFEFDCEDMELAIDGALYYREHVKVDKNHIVVPKLSTAVLFKKS